MRGKERSSTNNSVKPLPPQGPPPKGQPPPPKGPPPPRPGEEYKPSEPPKTLNFIHAALKEALSREPKARAQQHGFPERRSSDLESSFSSEYSDGSYSETDSEEEESRAAEEGETDSPPRERGKSPGEKKGPSVSASPAVQAEDALRSTAAAVRMLVKSKRSDSSSPKQVAFANAGGEGGGGGAAAAAAATPFSPSSASPEACLFKACQTGSVEETLDALHDGANAEAARRKDGMRALHVACRAGHTNVVRVLMRDASVKVNAVTVADASGANQRLTPLHCAALADHRAVVEAMLSMTTAVGGVPVDIDPRASDGSTPLHLAVREGSAAVTHALIAKGANVDARQNGGRTPLHVACARGRQAGVFVSMLLEASADPNIADDLGQLPLDIALGLGTNSHSVQLLKSYEQRGTPEASTQKEFVHDHLIFPEIALFMRSRNLDTRELFSTVFDPENTGSVSERDFADAVTRSIGLNITSATVQRLRRSWGAPARSRKMTFTEFHNACEQAEHAEEDNSEEDDSDEDRQEGRSRTDLHDTRPSSWHEVVDPVTKRIMYWNPRTMKATWQQPPGLMSFQETNGSESLVASPVSPKPPRDGAPPRKSRDWAHHQAVKMLVRGMGITKQQQRSGGSAEQSNAVTMTPGNAPWQAVMDPLSGDTATRTLDRTVLSGASLSPPPSAGTSSPPPPIVIGSMQALSPHARPQAAPLSPIMQSGTPKIGSPILNSPATMQRGAEEPGIPQPKMRVKKEVQSAVATWLCCWSGTWASTLARAVSSNPPRDHRNATAARDDGGASGDRGLSATRFSAHSTPYQQPNNGSASYHASRAAATMKSSPTKPDQTDISQPYQQPNNGSASYHASRAAAAMISPPTKTDQSGNTQPNPQSNGSASYHASRAAAAMTSSPTRTDQSENVQSNRQVNGSPAYHASKAVSAMTSSMPKSVSAPHYHATRAAKAMVSKQRVATPTIRARLGGLGSDPSRPNYDGLGSAAHLDNTSPSNKHPLEFGTAVARMGASEEGITNGEAEKKNSGRHDGEEGREEKKKDGEAEQVSSTHSPKPPPTDEANVGEETVAPSFLRIRIDGPVPPKNYGGNLSEVGDIPRRRHSDPHISGANQNALPPSVRDWARMIHSGKGMEVARLDLNLDK
jgi:ankyrin repeat protein